jgi:hypothetical protein
MSNLRIVEWLDFSMIEHNVSDIVFVSFLRWKGGIEGVAQLESDRFSSYQLQFE